MEAPVSGCLPLDFDESFGVGSALVCTSSETRARFVALTPVLRIDFNFLGVGFADILGDFNFLREKKLRERDHRSSDQLESGRHHHRSEGSRNETSQRKNRLSLNFDAGDLLKYPRSKDLRRTMKLVLRSMVRR